MIESLLFALDLVLVTYACWLVFRASKKSSPEAPDLGLFAYKVSKDEDRR